MHHLFDQETFAAKFRKLVEGRFKRYGHFEYDTEAEILRYQVRSPFTLLLTLRSPSKPKSLTIPTIPPPHRSSRPA